MGAFLILKVWLCALLAMVAIVLISTSERLVKDEHIDKVKDGVRVMLALIAVWTIWYIAAGGIQLR